MDSDYLLSIFDIFMDEQTNQTFDCLNKFKCIGKMLQFHDWFIRRRNIPIAFLHFKLNYSMVQFTVNQFGCLVDQSVYTRIIYLNACELVSVTIDIVWTGNRTHCLEYHDRFGAMNVSHSHTLYLIQFYRLCGVISKLKKKKSDYENWHTDRWIVAYLCARFCQLTLL